jgi:type II secretory pathway pseudopilin PulG
MRKLKNMKPKTRQGFTIVEMLIVAPIVILVIGVFIGAIVTITGNVLVSRASNSIAYNIQDALNGIKQDVSVSSGFLATNNITVTSPQGYNDGSTAFLNSGNGQGGIPALILNMNATSKNPLDPTSQTVYASGQPNSCSSANLAQNSPVIVNVVYYVKNGSLWRRVVIPKTTWSNFKNMGCPIGADIYQRPTCTNTDATFCISQDQRLVDNLQDGGTTGFLVNYFTDPSLATDNANADATANSTSASDSARQTALKKNNTVKVTIVSDATIAGRQKIQTGSITATCLNNNINSQVITHPSDVSNATPGGSVTFNATTSASSATIQWQQSTDQGNTWTNLTNSGATTWNSTGLTINPAPNTMAGNKYRAVFTNGLDVAKTNAASLNFDWSTLTGLGANWTYYPGAWSGFGSASLAYRKTSAGVVILRGLLQKSNAPVPGEVIATLPAGYAPAGQLIFDVGGYNGANCATRVDINTSGQIIFQAGTTGSANWVSLEGIHFIPNDGRYNNNNSLVTVGTLLNSWVNYAGGYMSASYVVDSLNRVHTQGLVKSGTATDGTPIFSLPTSLLPDHYMHIANITNPNIAAAVGVSVGSAAIVSKPNVSNSWLSMQAMFYPSSTTAHPVAWNNLTLLNGWVNYDVNTYTTASYTKGADGIVSVRGLVKSGTTTTDTVIATLPVGYRPAQSVLATADTNSTYGRVDIDTSGNIKFESGSNVWFSLDDINFYAP